MLIEIINYKYVPPVELLISSIYAVIDVFFGDAPKRVRNYFWHVTCGRQAKHCKWEADRGFRDGEGLPDPALRYRLLTNTICFIMYRPLRYSNSVFDSVFK